ncbi:MAG TPA: 16S rRNA (guanine(527)-N(7))-methyltransferase RsmG [Actinobacteria bacterium]|nr:16S rRNA (guanine(527)-N(7))-methyltransferase RsmG [Actinomycetota bacterium]
MGRRIAEDAVGRLQAYGRWLVEEAIPAGGLGPREAARLWDRHLLDALSFAGAFRREPDGILDLGSGVGLPGIPLAILHSDVEVVLLDRSQRRVDLARRAVRLLGLGNVEVVAGELERTGLAASTVVARGVAAPARLLPRLLPRIAPGGLAVVGLSRARARPASPPPPPGTRLELVSVPPDVLDSGAWLLRMEVPRR